MSILHISADHPDPIASEKTRAVSMLIDLVGSEFQQSVISLNRVNMGLPKAVFALLSGSAGTPLNRVAGGEYFHGEALQYRAPSHGLFLRSFLQGLADKLLSSVAQCPNPPNLLVGHKLTIEGILVHRMASAIGCPYALTIQGDTDTKILRARPDLRGLYRQVFHEAAAVVSFAPWSLDEVERLLGTRMGPKHVIPCPTELDTPMAPQSIPNLEFASVFHLQNHRRKNLSGMVQALNLLRQDGSSATLNIIGGGSKDHQTAVQAVAGDAQGVVFEGAVARDSMSGRLNSASAMVLPSLRETFGLVFIEALFAGCPIIYPKDRAVDGFFDGEIFAQAVNPKSAAEIANAMQRVNTYSVEMREALAQWQASEGAARFTRLAIARNYANILRDCLRRGAVGAS